LRASCSNEAGAIHAEIDVCNRSIVFQPSGFAAEALSAFFAPEEQGLTALIIHIAAAA
jgi:hypothetical protein